MRAPGNRFRISVGAKFAAMITCAAAVVIALSAAVVVQRFTAQDDVQAKAAAAQTAAALSAAVSGVFQSAFEIVGTANEEMIALKDDGIVDPAVYSSLLKRALQDQPYRFGAWVVWDADDAPRDVAKAQGARGALSIYWHQNGMEIVRDYIPQDIIASDLFAVPYRERRPYLLEPHSIDAVAGDPTTVTSFAKPLEHDDRVVGVIALDIKLDAIVEALGGIRLPDGASFAVVSEAGTVAMSTEAAWIGKSLRTVSTAWSTLFSKVQREGDGSQTSQEQNGGGRNLTSWSAIRFSDVKNPWYLLMKVPERSLIATGFNDRLFLFVVAAGICVAILLIASLSLNHIVGRPLRDLSVIIGGLSSGLFDFVVPCRHRNDEIGDIARAVERLQDSGVEIARLKEANGEAEYQRGLKRRAELDDISRRFSESVEGLVISLERVATTVHVSSREVSRSSKAGVGRLQEVSEVSLGARTKMQSVATATAALVSTIDAIGERTCEGKAAAAKVQRYTASSETAIERLKSTILDIEGVSHLISGVASQINLIALNATIEAARAGEAGRSFAIVAQEIKDLAGQTARATDEIGRHIASVHRASGETDVSIVEMRDAFTEMRTISSDIASVLDVQLGTASEIGRLMDAALKSGDTTASHINALVTSSTDTRKAADSMQAESGSLSKQIAQLDGEVKNFLRFLQAA